MRVRLWLIFFLAVASLASALRATGFDSGLNATALSALDAGLPVSPAGTWVRVRGVVDPVLTGPAAEASAVAEKVEAERKALDELHQAGFRICVLIMPGKESWAKGVRGSPGAVLPLDLREAYDRMFHLGETYRGLVDAWEIGNEPDIGFVGENAENYAAFLKASYFGVRDGGARSAMVLMASLALPPGPYLERLLKNGILSYTNGFNYHYYGYARDFTGVYRQFEDAVRSLNSESAEHAEIERNNHGSTSGPSATSVLRTKSLPVFITEFGYGLLDGVARDTVAGRVRQWSWFRDVAGQIRKLEIEGPMAFLLTPYFERGKNEFGLTMAGGAGAGGSEGQRSGGPEERRVGASEDRRGGGSEFRSGGLIFTPGDFGAKKAEPWMELIGQPVAGGLATPALAWMVADAAKPAAPVHDWTVRVSPASPVVIDFVGAPDALPYKSYHGFMLMDSGRGHGELRLYNFSPVAQSGLLSLSGTARVRAESSPRITLKPGALLTIPLEMETDDAEFSAHEWTVGFTPDNSETAPATFTTAFFPNATGMTKTVLLRFDHDEKSSKRNRSQLLQRELAPEEPRLSVQGRWLVTPGVAVTESDGAWRFNVTGYPPEPLRPAMAELPLPSGFKFPSGAMFTFDHRAVLPLENGRQDQVEIYFRTANGNLFDVWPPFLVTDLWQTYSQNRENFSMGFFGRAALPWQFEKNECVSLLFYFRPHPLPMTYEIRNAEIVSWKR